MPNDLVYGDWLLTALADADVSALGSDRPATITIEGAELRGYGGVNRFSAKLDGTRLQRGEIVAGPAAVTRRAGPPEAMAVEQKLLALLETGCAYRIEGDQLVLLAAGSERARFARR